MSKNLYKLKTSNIINWVLFWKNYSMIMTDNIVTSNSVNDSCVIGTHDGIFHSDEILGCFMLRILYPNANIIRSRNLEILKNCDILIDVGNVYDVKNNHFDHHQKSFTHTMSTLSKKIKSDVKLSSAGLIYHHFGEKILRKVVGNSDTDLIDFVYCKLYDNLIKEIDGIDNGIPPFSSEPLYNINTHISTRVNRLNKKWNTSENEYNVTLQFEKAISMVGEEFMENINILKNINYPARKIVLDAIKKRYVIHSFGEIIELNERCPWRDHLFDLEQELKLDSKIKYVLFSSDDNYRVQAVPITPDSFECRKFLPKEWRGIRDKELSEKVGIDGCIFVHSNGFIGGHVNREGALKMAIKSLEY